MTANFNDTAIGSVFDKLVSFALATGRFAEVNQHEPKSAPGNELHCSVWVDGITPIKGSGVAAVSGVVQFNIRIYSSFVSQPFDAIDPAITAATTDLMGSLCGDFDFGSVADVRMVDLLGAYGAKLAAKAGYLEIDRKIFRVMTLVVPVIINDMFAEVG